MLLETRLLLHIFLVNVGNSIAEHEQLSRVLTVPHNLLGVARVMLSDRVGSKTSCTLPNTIRMKKIPVLQVSRND